MKKQPQAKFAAGWGDFRCVGCGMQVTARREIAGVNNRNHCPFCLASRHVDEHRAGDRQASCQSRMDAVALTLKKSNKKYASPNSGELMLVHVCSGCGKLSINRIAADDRADRIVNVFHASQHLDEELLADLAGEGIDILGADQETLVLRSLYGNASVEED